MSLLKKYWATLRRLRLLHVLHNMRHYRRLKENKTLYSKFGIRRSVVGSLSHKDITNPGGEIPWLDQPGAKEKLRQDPRLAKFPVRWQEQLLQWPEKGYMILDGFADTKTCDTINEEQQRLVNTHAVDFDYTESRVMNMWKHSPNVEQLIHEKQLTDFLSFALGRTVLPFQTISFFKGSQQKTHSDSIHMTTEPLGYLVATWLALEDITAESGPLHYYPGSHHLPYVMGENFSHSSNFFAIGDDLYEKYEQKIEEVVASGSFRKEIFHAKKGDLLVWHANLLHGGEPVTNANSSRKSLVTHYFCKGDVVCYHEITQRPAILPV